MSRLNPGVVAFARLWLIVASRSMSSDMLVAVMATASIMLASGHLLYCHLVVQREYMREDHRYDAKHLWADGTIERQPIQRLQQCFVAHDLRSNMPVAPLEELFGQRATAFQDYLRQSFLGNVAQAYDTLDAQRLLLLGIQVGGIGFQAH